MAKKAAKATKPKAKASRSKAVKLSALGPDGLVEIPQEFPYAAAGVFAGWLRTRQAPDRTDLVRAAVTVGLYAYGQVGGSPAGVGQALAPGAASAPAGVPVQMALADALDAHREAFEASKAKKGRKGGKATKGAAPAAALNLPAIDWRVIFRLAIEAITAIAL